MAEILPSLPIADGDCGYADDHKNRPAGLWHRHWLNLWQ
jgi:hypothetical protein